MVEEHYPAFLAALTAQGQVRYELKTAYRDGTTHVVFEPLDFIARLAALVPRPSATAPCCAWMHECRGRRDAQERLGWAQRLKRVFAIDIEQCERCGGKVKIIASIEGPAVIERILAHGRRAQAYEPRVRLD